MRVPVSWLTEPVALDEIPSADDLAESLIRVGFEVEDVETLEPVTGPLVVGRVLEIEELTEFKKPIRFCRVDVGSRGSDPTQPQGIVCGATNFAVGDLVVAALPGTTLPGDFSIAGRKTYGRVSDGMICALDELGLGDDHSGILVLPPGTADPGDDAAPLLGLDPAAPEAVLDIAVNPDRGYALSVRGMGREVACAFDAPFGDPASVDQGLPAVSGEAWPVRVEPDSGCRRFAARRVTGLDPTAPTPWWMHRRLLLAGIRPISLAVDVTNYVMLELGQPMHAYDAARVTGDVVVRRARTDEKLTTLDDVSRALDPDDVAVCDDSGPIGLAGVMGGAATEVTDATSDVLLEAATWDPAAVARAARRHKLPSEAARRFERSVDPAVARAATDRAAALLERYGRATVEPGVTDVGPFPEGQESAAAPIRMALDLPDRVAGIAYARGASVRRLVQVGCAVDVPDDGGLAVTPPTWRPDLTRPADLVEEVLRLEGYDVIPSELPVFAGGTGLTLAQRRRRQVSRALADAGYQEVLPSPFTSPSVFDAFGLDADDPRRSAVRLANPLDADRSLVATTLLPGLLDAVVRNVSRGLRDLALFHVGQVARPDRGERSDGKAAWPPGPAPEVGVDARPSDAQIRALLDPLPAQPLRVGAVLTGAWERAGWWGEGRPATWADAVGAARTIAAVYGAELTVTADRHAPWHPGRCAALYVGDVLVGHAGELHPQVLENLGLPPRTCAMELELDRLPVREVLARPEVSPFPPVLLDVALVTPVDVPVAAVQATLTEGGGELLEDVRLFDVYSGAQVGEGRRSLAFALRFRAPDRTLTLDEAAAARDRAVALAGERHGAVLR
ncbi:phenylalanine--tRNA ligase subunit beta [Actinomycetospora sp. TBRC 11914]|uniref:phenylalanine--tRNA ligase subunit beta n=1 Tax=Actinomycetospora sp. TBRC 11914 TaxID=2729387 RepID=UPI00145C5CB7|nr:phenylalanine--tRNA ligase subunit beta [Actinomycetospora sp. TBRC 11914]NMO94059.1 phenylalanine--tRNA ligase subunit beta [Actinomycetospora sp. TBRC 11914]